MKTLLLIFLMCCSIIPGCKKAQTGDCADYLKATVILTNDFSCHIPLLDFSEDSIRIRALTNLNTLNYSVTGLPSNLNVQNKKLYVSVTLLNAGEEFPCNDLGIVYPHLKAICSQSRE